MGDCLEKLVNVAMENDPLRVQAYAKVWLFIDWSIERGLPPE